MMFLTVAHARAAGAAGPRALLDVGDGLAALLGHRADDVGLRDVVARADLRLVGHPELDAVAGRKDELLGVVGQREPALDHRPQHAVRRRVADQDPAEQPERPVPCVGLCHDELLVDARDRVGVRQLERAVGGRERVAEARHVDAEELELGGHVGAGEGAGTVEERVDDDLRHRVARRDEAVHRAARCRTLADREDAGVGGAALLVDEHTAARGHLEVALAGQGVARPDAGREHHDLRVDDPRRSALLGAGLPDAEAGDGRPALDLFRDHSRVHGDAEPLDVPHQGRARRTVELDGHQPRRHLDDVRLQAELDERVGRLEPEQPAADHDTAGRRGAGRPDRLEVLDRAVDEAAVLAAALDRRDERRRAGRQHQHVVLVDGDGARVRQQVARCAGRRHDRDGPRSTVDLGHHAVQHQPHPRVVVLPAGQQRQRLGPVALRVVAEPARERDPVVGRPRLLADHQDVMGLGEAALDGGLGEPVAHHAVPDDDDPLALARTHAEDGRKRMLSESFPNVSRRKTASHAVTRSGRAPRACRRARRAGGA